MENAITGLLRHLGPAIPRAPLKELVRAGLGAAFGIGCCVILVILFPSIAGFDTMLFAPLGASAVLVFAVPNSPLAQPWSAIVGNTVSALAAVAVLKFVPLPYTPWIAVGLAIMAMIAVRALHPPGGAVALLTTLSPGPVLAAGFWYALVPVCLVTATLVTAAVVYNRLTGRVYPFRQPAQAPEAGKAGDLRLGLSTEELRALLQRFRQSANVGVADFGRVLAAAEEEAARHRFAGTTCGDLMTAELITVTPDAPLARVAKLFRENAIKSIPVVDADGAFRGIVLQADLIAALLTGGGAAGWAGFSADAAMLTAGDVMQQPQLWVDHTLPVGVLLNRLARQGPQVVPVMRNERLAGILTRSDIIALLLRGGEERAAA